MLVTTNAGLESGLSFKGLSDFPGNLGLGTQDRSASRRWNLHLPRAYSSL